MSNKRDAINEMHRVFEGVSPIKVVRRVYDVDETVPPNGYTGVWEVYWKTGKIHSRTIYIDDREFGPFVCGWENGNPAQVGMKWDGESVGVWTDYYQDGTKSCEGVMGPNGREGEWSFVDIRGNMTRRIFKDGVETTL
jgi:antitoxin component YwqK of YwqJK toxin-antitoxin module